jgi:hypothetical protein
VRTSGAICELTAYFWLFLLLFFAFDCPLLAIDASFATKQPQKVHPPPSLILMEKLGSKTASNILFL